MCKNWIVLRIYLHLCLYPNESEYLHGLVYTKLFDSLLYDITIRVADQKNSLMKPP